MRSCYTRRMSEPLMDEGLFRRAADEAMEELKQALIEAEEEAEGKSETAGNFEVEEQSGALYVVFEKPAGKFVITPNTPVRQIWISARNTSFKLDLTTEGFVLAKTGETLTPLVMRLIDDHLHYR